MCEGASKQLPDLKNYTLPGPVPPVLKYLDPPLIHSCIQYWNLKAQIVFSKTKYFYKSLFYQFEANSLSSNKFQQDFHFIKLLFNVVQV